MNTIIEASHITTNLLTHPMCEEMEAKEVQNEGTMPKTLQKGEVIKDLDHEPKNILRSSLTQGVAGQCHM